MSELSFGRRAAASLRRRLAAARAASPGDLVATFALIAVVVFNLWVLRAERVDVPTPNDANVHASMIEWATGQFREGRIPFDGWFPVSSLGAARFHQYQSLPHLLVSAVQAVTGWTGLVSWSLYLLLALWPIAVYTSARLFGIRHRQAAFAAVLSPLLGGLSRRGFQWESYIFGGVGLWAQAWGMWLLPFAWATSWRAVSGRGSVPVAAVILGLTVPTHLLIGYLAVLSVPLFVLLVPGEIRVRMFRAGLLGVGALAAAAWFLVPFLSDRAFIPHAEIYDGKAQFDSFGLEGLVYLVKGLVFDVVTRAPVVTVIVGWGLWRSIARAREDETRRALLALFGLSLLLFLGRPVLGPIVDLLPGGEDLFLNRFIVGVHMAGLFLAGIGAETFTSLPSRDRRSAAPMSLGALGPVALTVVVGLSLLAPFGDRMQQAAGSARKILAQRIAEAKDGAALDSLLDRVDAPGRIFTGFSLTTLQAWDRPEDAVVRVARFGFVNLNAELSRRGHDIIGLPRPAWSLMSVQEGRFDDSDPSHYALFGARYALLAEDETPKVPATRIASDAGLTLWEIDGAPSYLRVVQTEGPAIVADRNSIGSAGAAVLATDGPREGIYRPVAFGDLPAAEPTGVDPAFIGEVLDVEAASEDGRFSGTVRASGPADVVLSASYDPRWVATVDGRPADVEMLAPALPAVRVEAGEHEVVFTYVPVGGYWVRIALGALALVGIGFAARRFVPIAPPTPGPVAPEPKPSASTRAERRRQERRSNKKRKGRR